MIDLDRIKAAGLNDAEHSAQLLLMHAWRQRVRLHADLCAAFLRDEPHVTSPQFERFASRAWDQLPARVC